MVTTVTRAACFLSHLQGLGGGGGRGDKPCQAAPCRHGAGARPTWEAQGNQQQREEWPRHQKRNCHSHLPQSATGECSHHRHRGIITGKSGGGQTHRLQLGPSGRSLHLVQVTVSTVATRMCCDLMPESHGNRISEKETAPTRLCPEETTYRVTEDAGPTQVTGPLMRSVAQVI